MHPSARRLYQVAKSLDLEGPSAVARWLNEAPQTINNWERRGVSRRGAVEAQKRSGFNAVWILDGSGEPRPGGLADAAAARSQHRLETLTAEERRFLESLRRMDDEEKRRLLKELSAKTARRRPAR